MPWITYADAGARLGVSAHAVRAIAQRRRWPRRRSNTDPHGAVEVQMPDDFEAHPKPPARTIITGSSPDQSDLAANALALLETSLFSLSERAAAAEARAERADARAEAAEAGRGEERARADRAEAQVIELKLDAEMARGRLELAQADAQAAAQRAEAMKAADDARQAAGLLTRLRAALRGR